MGGGGGRVSKQVSKIHFCGRCVFVSARGLAIAEEAREHNT